MNFLEAIEFSQKKNLKEKEEINIISSFNTDVLNIFIKALYAKNNINLSININPFDTLKQTILKKNSRSKNDIYLILSWDFCEQLNWRNGLSKKINYFHEAKKQIDEFSNILSEIRDSRIIYFDLPIPKILLNINENFKIEKYIHNNAKVLSDLVIQDKIFDLDRFLATGLPFQTSKLFEISKKIFKNNQIPLKKKNKLPKTLSFKNSNNFELNAKKILAVDFDDTLWKGVVADEGYNKIKCGNDILGYKHYVFQNIIKNLISKGILVIGVTKNRLSEAKKGFLNKDSKLKSKDFVKIFASYEKKSTSIQAAYKAFNLKQDNVVFVDDNIIEIKEVKTVLPKVEVIHFPDSTENVPKFIEKLNLYFQKKYITKEDLKRINNYKNHISFNRSIIKKNNFNLNNFLKKLKMTLMIKKINYKNYEELIRPHQLINKTNQFNLNGIRISESKILKILKNGGKLFSGFYKDKNGDYGEIITILLDKNNLVKSFVMSCRVFQRKIELVFLIKLINSGIKIDNFMFRKTPKNEISTNFFKINLKDYIDINYKFINRDSFVKKNNNLIKLFKIKKVNF